jgi:SMI1 / KNR4 family (SUKH-1)
MAPCLGYRLERISGGSCKAARTRKTDIRPCLGANRSIRRADPEAVKDKQIREVKPVKMGGDPVDPANKVAVDSQTYGELNKFWQNSLQVVAKWSVMKFSPKPPCRMNELLARPFNLGAPAEPVNVRNLQGRLPGAIPSDYYEFLLLGDGGTGDVGGGEYAMLWSSDEIEKNNIAYEVAKYAPGLILFGSNGGGEAFAFDTTQTVATIGIVPFVGMSCEEYRPIAATFHEFLNRLASGLAYEGIIGADLSRH